MSFGLGSGRRQDRYFVVPKERQRGAGGNPGGWLVKKGPTVQGSNTVKSFNNKQAARRRAKELARKNNTTLEVFDTAMKTSDPFDFR